jgi:uncharacterized protein (DUF2147 family)
VALLLGFASAARGASAPARAVFSPVGLWTTPDGKTRIRLGKCGDSLCGTVAWLRNPLTKSGKRPRDVKNPNPGLRRRSIVGMRLMGGFAQSRTDPDLWEKGWVYDPQSGKTYSCTITVESARTLQLHGYLGLSVLGASQAWTRIGRYPRKRATT